MESISLTPPFSYLIEKGDVMTAFWKRRVKIGYFSETQSGVAVAIVRRFPEAGRIISLGFYKLQNRIVGICGHI